MEENHNSKIKCLNLEHKVAVETAAGSPGLLVTLRDTIVCISFRYVSMLLLETKNIFAV